MPSGITKKDVWQIAETLVQKDEMPTIVNVRSQLGGGNPHTIASHLASWREEHMKEEMLFYTERELFMATQREMEQERVGLMGEIERLDAEIEKARKEPSTATHDLAVEKKAHERTKTQIKDYQQRLKEAQGNAEKLAEQNRTLQAEAAALKERSTHAKQLKAQVEKLQGELADLAKAKTTGKESELQGDARKLAQHNQALQVEIATLKERAAHVEALKAQVEKLQGELASLARSKETEKEDKPSEPQDTTSTGGAKQEVPKEAPGAQKKTLAQESQKPSSPPPRAPQGSEKPETVRK
uniref:Replication region DNA-binding N-term n=1 Tax=Candidatus Kentrum sp. FM TaxID=2126340 RepID=A0A450T7P9_9GAMM|nr:MAG: replication region DNA-binding N-term [Candidatus Kentron sp. FM]VFJ62860.1 MAG: replication region DNA-binding N-term [Candidatus Kentron sp. FM]VFK14129.1 MAG: replication region DNA-binding N-term [Candidatus Kentron sp. FM]